MHFSTSGSLRSNFSCYAIKIAFNPQDEPRFGTSDIHAMVLFIPPTVVLFDIAYDLM